MPKTTTSTATIDCGAFHSRPVHTRLGLKYLDAAVELVGDVDVALTVDGHTAGECTASIVGKLIAPAKLELAGTIAVEEKIDMNDDHWEVVNFLRDYYEEYQIAPAVRVLTKAVKKSLGPDKGNSKYLYELFPYGPAKQACKIAGLPKPTGCV